MDSDSTAIISENGAEADQSQAIQALTNQPDWPARFKICARRSAAGLVDLSIMSSLSLFFWGLPFLANKVYETWEPSGTSAPTPLSHLIEHSLYFAAAIALLNQLYFYTALAESGQAQASPGKILFGLKTTDTKGHKQTFGGVLGRLNLKYVLFVLLCTAASFLIKFAAEFIPSLQIEQLRTLMGAVIVASSFALCMVTDREQNLYDMITGRLVVLDGTGSIGERLRHFAAELRSIAMALNPLALAGGAKKYGSSPGDAKGIVTILLVVWTYISSATGAILLVFACQIGLGISEVESGVTAQSRHDTDLAAQHFKKAVLLCPGIAVIYQAYYALNDNIDLSRQEAACTRLLAVRGNAQDYLARARVRAKQQNYQESESDYKQALSGRHGELDPRDTDAADTELAMLKLEEEAASIPGSPSQPMHVYRVPVLNLK
jgi:uncharacterized RDD family membrane protein YckC